MAQEIKDGVYGYVSGTVGRSFTTKNGRAFEMEVKDPKAQYGDKWTIWGDLAVTEGDRASVKGWLSISRETYEKDGEQKVAVKRAVNKPELAAHEVMAQHASGGEPWADQPASADSWADSTPF